jgi:mannose-6-phosphate isomerase-like protein (cupin superfamily)
MSTCATPKQAASSPASSADDTRVTIPIGHDDGTDGVSVIDSAGAIEDEVFHVLEAELRLRIGESDLRVGAGETALAPKGVPHTYRVESADGARWLVITRRWRVRTVRQCGQSARRRV